MKKLATLATVVLATIFASSGSAVAAYKLYTGLYATSGETVLAEIDRTTNVNNKVHKDTASASGDRMKIDIPFRDRQPSNGKSVHASVKWLKNSRNCSLSGVEIHITGGGYSTSCDDSWTGNGDYASNNVSGSGWWVVNPTKAFNGTDNSLRGGIHVCQAQWNSDPCSGKRWVTTFWN